MAHVLLRIGHQGLLLGMVAVLIGMASARVEAKADRWWHSAVFYEVFVRSFADSNGDGVGDFKGLTGKLDTLKDLGVDALWLMPIQASPSYHGYDVTDYRAVNPDYGTMADFEALLKAAHERDIKIVIDFVMNHSSVEHPWFKEAAARPDSPKRGWYTWRKDNPGWTQPWGSGPVWHKANNSFYYGLFWSGMPDLNLGHPEVEAEMVASMKFWLAKGVDGFRVDAARHFFESADGKLSDQPASHTLMKRVRAAIEQDHPEALLIGEIWTDPDVVATYYGDASKGGDEFHLAFGFGSGGALRESARDGLRAAFNQHARVLTKVYADPRFEAPFLANHDMPRTRRQFKGDMGAMRIAAAALFALPGTPFIYYGEEIGMQGGPEKRDEDKRTPMRWTSEAPGYGFTTAQKAWHQATEADGVNVAAQQGKPGSLWTLFKDLIALRHAHKALQTGALSQPAIQGGGRGVTRVLRTHANGARVLVVLNFNEKASEPISVSVKGSPKVLFAEGLKGEVRRVGDRITIGGLEGRGVVFIGL